jgi:hypothetical protein
MPIVGQASWRRRNFVWVLVPPLSILGCQSTPPPPPAHSVATFSPESARAVMLQTSVGSIGAHSVCLAADPRSVPSTQSLTGTDVRELFGDIAPPKPDAGPALIRQLSRSDVVPLSQCPDREARNSYHVIAGPVRILSPTRVEMAVVVNMDGFPEYYVCAAEGAHATWRALPCKMVAQS